MSCRKRIKEHWRNHVREVEIRLLIADRSVRRGYDPDGLHIIADDIYFRQRHQVHPELWKYCDPNAFVVNPDHKLPKDSETRSYWQKLKWRLIHLAARSNDPTYVEVLLNIKADPNVRDAEGWTPLMIACQQWRPIDILELLLRYGADQSVVLMTDSPYGRLFAGRTALEIYKVSDSDMNGRLVDRPYVEKLFQAYMIPPAPPCIAPVELTDQEANERYFQREKEKKDSERRKRRWYNYKEWSPHLQDLVFSVIIFLIWSAALFRIFAVIYRQVSG